MLHYYYYFKTSTVQNWALFIKLYQNYCYGMTKDLLFADVLCSHYLGSLSGIVCQLHCSWNTSSLYLTTLPFIAQSIEITISGSVSDTSLSMETVLIFPAAPPYHFVFTSIGKTVLFLWFIVIWVLLWSLPWILTSSWKQEIVLYNCENHSDSKFQ